MVEDAPVALEFEVGDGQGDDGAAGEFGGGDPAGGDADAEAEFDEFDEGFGGAEFDEGVETDALPEEVGFDFAEGGGAAVLEDEVLGGEAFAVGRGAVVPWVDGADEEDEVIGKHAAAGEAGGVRGLDAENEVGGVVIEEATGFDAVARLDHDGVVREAFAEFSQDGGEEVAGGVGGAGETELTAEAGVDVREVGAGFGHL